MNSKATMLPASPNGLRLMLLITSNAYRDREQEIVSQKALEEYVEESWDGDAFIGDNVLLVWHAGDPIGDIVYAEMEGPFLIEVAQERPNAVINLAAAGEEPLPAEIKAVWDALEDETDMGASQGFYPVAMDRKDGVYQKIDKEETSTLPRFVAANYITDSWVVGARL